MDIRQELDECKNPLFFFHDDPDGVCSFLQLYDYIREGYGVIVKSRPMIDMKFLARVEQYKPDKIFVLDIARMEQEFADAVRVPVIWIDHHPPQDVKGVKYVNPRLKNPDDHSCIANVTYRMVEQKLWLAVAGSVGDMQWPDDLIQEFRKRYSLLGDATEPRQATYETELGKLVRILSFVLKGTSSDAMKYVKALTRIDEPDEILEGKTARGRFILKRYEQINEEYIGLLKDAVAAVDDSPLALFTYKGTSMSFTSDLANEMTYRYPDKVIMMGREKSGEVKMSIRTDRYVLPAMIDKALVGLTGYGGGHEHASGACVNSEQFDDFVKAFREQL